MKHAQICCCLSVFVRLFILTSGVRGHDGIGYESIVSLRVLTEADKRACWCLVLTAMLCEPLCFKHILRLTAGHVTTTQRHHYHLTRSEMMINNLISSSDLRFCCLNGLISLQWTLLKRYLLSNVLKWLMDYLLMFYSEIQTELNEKGFLVLISSAMSVELLCYFQQSPECLWTQARCSRSLSAGGLDSIQVVTPSLQLLCHLKSRLSRLQSAPSSGSRFLYSRALLLMSRLQ